MSEIRETALPRGCALWRRFQDGDFLDCYVTYADLTPREAAEQAVTFPRWAAALLALRNMLVAPFGLKTTHGQNDSIGVFPVAVETEDEIILGFDDKHLDFRIAIRREGGQIFAATWVHRNNGFGRAYLRLIMPFHKLIMRDAMRRISAAGADG